MLENDFTGTKRGNLDAPNRPAEFLLLYVISQCLLKRLNGLDSRGFLPQYQSTRNYEENEKQKGFGNVSTKKTEVP